MSRKFIYTLVTIVILVVLLVISTLKTSGVKTFKVGATPVPHTEILHEVQKDFESKTGVKLEIVEFTDYVQPNLALEDGSIDANFFQHLPYLEKFSSEKNLTDLISVAKIHVEPMGFYLKKDFSKIESGDTVVIPNDSTNEGRALLLLEKNGIITLDSTDIVVSIKNIVKNKYNIKFLELDAAFVPRTYRDDNSVIGAVINTNYAIQTGLNPLKDAKFLEDKDSPYSNIIAIKESNKDNELLKEFLKVLESEKIRKFILQKYNGSVLPVF